MSVLNYTGLPVQHQQPGRIPRFDGFLGNQLLGQLIIKIVGAQIIFLFLIYLFSLYSLL
jgi:hypothetical protein